ncbi:response regulator transcription factor [uncultured Slackia sp.]|uniref:response regulator transcription factor n=1 Tax=Slackia sp. TaxID=2049041 RepID=UPI00260B190A|nr:response regulator transcription factor [uncultured Slackia sp.]
MKVLIVEDDTKLAQALGRILEESDYTVDMVHDGTTGRDWAVVGDYDAIILDVMMPGMDGYEVVREIRHANVDTPVLMLTARGSVSDKIAGLDHGADDYMTKPFSPAELMAHLRALMRRQGSVIFESIDAGDVSLKLDSHELARDEKTIHLSKTEFALAKMLMSNKERILPKEMIIEKIWGIESSAADNNVEAYVSFLRKKLRYLESDARIETIRKVGYKFTE